MTQLKGFLQFRPVMVESNYLEEANTQALLESDETFPSKFLQLESHKRMPQAINYGEYRVSLVIIFMFIENLGILLRVTANNQIEVWDLETKKLSHLHDLGQEVSSFTVPQQSLYMYVGYSSGNIAVLKLDQEQQSCTSEVHYSILSIS